MPETNTMLPARVQVDTGAPHFLEIAVNRLDPDDLSLHASVPDPCVRQSKVFAETVGEPIERQVQA